MNSKTSYKYDYHVNPFSFLCSRDIMAKQPANKYANFNAEELKAYEINKKKLFKGTIAVCVVYGVFAVMLLLIALLNTRGREILAGDLMPFVVTFVASMVLIIIFIVVLVLSFKPKKMQSDLYDPDSCPDYWKMEETPETEIPNDVSDEEKFLMKYRCVPDTNIYDMQAKWNGTELIPNSTGSSTPFTNVYNQNVIKQGEKHYAYKPISGTNNVSTALKNASQTMYKSFGDNNLPSLSNLRCDIVYPAYLAAEDVKTFENRPNTLRCAYANTCGIPWTTVCPDKN